MLRKLSAVVLGVLLAGCAAQPQWESEAKQELFRPSAMRIHPVFTQVRDWTGDGKPDGLEVLVEFQDQFGDPAKAAGNVVFEVYSYRPSYPDPRGQREVPPFQASTITPADQQDHWSRTSRCYIFQLAWPQVNPRKAYILTASFELEGGKRYFDQIALEPPVREPAVPSAATKPVNQPGTRTVRP